MKSTYGVNREDGAHFQVKQRVSQIWKAATWGADLLRNGLRWEARNGERIFFWKDVWLASKLLQEEVNSMVEENQL